jgi:hypothetical protein
VWDFRISPFNEELKELAQDFAKVLRPVIDSVRPYADQTPLWEATNGIPKA